MKRIFILCGFLGISLSVHAASSWDGKAPVEYIVTVEPDHGDALYHQGDTVTFNVDLQQNHQPVPSGSVDWILTKDGVMPPIQTGTATIANGRGTITGTLHEPGFLHLQVTFKNGLNVYTALSAAGFDPEQIKPSMPVPDDFDAFWAEQKKKLAAVPVNPKLTPVPAPPDRPGLETFDFQADCVGAPASGYYARPAGAKPKSCPALLYVEGAGVQSADVVVPSRWAQKGIIAIDLNSHGIPNGKPRDFYMALQAGDLKDYRTHGSQSRDTYYFLGMYLRELRALDFLVAQPEWDGKTLIMEGGSQGGAQAIAAAALDPRITYLVALDPACCDHTGLTIGRIVGWPKLVKPGPDGKPDPAILEASRYFDSVNFATRVKAPSSFWVSYLDVLCPPTTVYAAYNSVTAPKEIHPDPDFGHLGNGIVVWPTVTKKVLDFIEKQKTATASANPQP